MGIDIYLNGYDAFEARTREEKAEFERLVAVRDALPKDGPESGAARDAAQTRVSEAYDKMYDGSKGYIRSSYNGGGLFRVLDEVFGFDIGGYLFDGDWDAEPGVPIDGKKFCAKVEALQATAALALSRKELSLPWTGQYSEVTGARAPDGENAARAGGECFGDSIAGLLKESGVEFDGGPIDKSAMLCQRHVWYLTEGLSDLRRFGELAKQLGESGEPVYAYISY